MAHDHSHVPTEGGHERPLWIALALTTTILVAELLGAWLTRSLALFSDAAHMLTDAAALAIALAAIRFGRRAADARRTYGYARFEILAAAFNATVLCGVAVFILIEAIERFRNPPQIDSLPMLAIAFIGLVGNLISIRILRSASETNLNMKGAYLEVWSDMLGSLGVMLAAAVIYFTGWRQADPIIAVAIGLWVLPRTWILLKQSLNILLQGVPPHVDLEEIAREIRATSGVLDLHDLHVWAVSSGKSVLTVHILLADASSMEDQRFLNALRSRLAERFDIGHITVQIERAACSEGDRH